MKQIKVLLVIVLSFLLGTWYFATAWTTTTMAQSYSTDIRESIQVIESPIGTEYKGNENGLESVGGSMISPKTGEDNMVPYYCIVIGLGIIIVILIIATIESINIEE